MTVMMSGSYFSIPWGQYLDESHKSSLLKCILVGWNPSVHPFTKNPVASSQIKSRTQTPLNKILIKIEIAENKNKLLMGRNGQTCWHVNQQLKFDPDFDSERFNTLCFYNDSWKKLFLDVVW